MAIIMQAEAATIAGVTPWTIGHWIRQGKLKPVLHVRTGKPGVSKEELLTFLGKEEKKYCPECGFDLRK